MQFVRSSRPHSRTTPSYPPGFLFRKSLIRRPQGKSPIRPLVLKEIPIRRPARKITSSPPRPQVPNRFSPALTNFHPAMFPHPTAPDPCPLPTAHRPPTTDHQP